MTKHKNTIIKIIGILVGIGSLIWIKSKTSLVPGEKLAKEFLTQKIEDNQINPFLEQYRNNYKFLMQQYRLPSNRILRVHLKKAILPVLSFYLVLLHLNGGDKKTTIKEVEGVVRKWILNTTRYFICPLRFFSYPFRIFRPGFEIVMKLFPAAGFDIDYLEKSENRIAFDIKRCFYLNTLTRYGAPELTTVFCAADEAMAELFPSSIEFERTQTLGRGGFCCDFQYCKK